MSVFLRNVSFHEKNGFVCIVRKSWPSNFRNAVFCKHCWLFFLCMRLCSLIGCRDLLEFLKHKLFVTFCNRQPVWCKAICSGMSMFAKVCNFRFRVLHSCLFSPKKSVGGVWENFQWSDSFFADLHLARFRQHNTVQSKLIHRQY